MKHLVLALIAVLACANASLATPVLQMDILNGTYVGGTSETIVATGNVFTLYAYLKPNSTNKTTDTYFISMALSPQVSGGTNLGSFMFAGQTINATADMYYGIPPLEAYLEKDKGDLAPHSIFPTYYYQHSFQFGTAQSGIYNTQDYTGQGPISGTGMYYQAFTVDVSNLNSQYVLHFDLYNSNLEKCKNVSTCDIDVTQFAPFSHDAESGPVTQVPEPITLILLGIGMIPLGLLGRNRK